MKILATFDARDYEGTTGIYEKYSIRAIIVRDGRLAMQCSQEGEYKIPGGGQEPGENYDVLDRQAPLSLTPSEIAKGYQLKWATPEEVYHRNILIEKDSWIIRDTAFVKMLMDGKIRLPG